MRYIFALSQFPISYLIFAAFSLFAILVSYAGLRAVHISVNWATWVVGTLIIAISAYACIVQQVNYANLFGVLAFPIAIYSSSQWISRHWYVYIKKHTKTFIAEQSRKLYLFFRQHHQFLGWLVLVTALAHTILFIPDLSRIGAARLVSGIVALAILFFSIGLGIWIEYFVRHKPVRKRICWLHSLTAIGFFIAFVVHVG